MREGDLLITSTIFAITARLNSFCSFNNYISSAKSSYFEGKEVKKFRISEFIHFKKFYSKKGNKFIFCIPNADWLVVNTRVIFIGYGQGCDYSLQRCE